MTIKREAFIGQYLEELRENLSHLETAVISLKRDPENDEELNRASRVLHTIKGSSRMLKFGTMEKIAHALETVFKGVKEKRYGIGDSLVQLVFTAAGAMREGARRIKAGGEDAMDIGRLQDACAKAYACEPYSLAGLVEESGPALPDEAPGSKGTDPGRLQALDYQSVRVRTDQIDEIIKRLNNLIINQFQFKKHYEGIRTFEENLKALTASWLDGRSADAPQAGPLLKEFQKIRKSFIDQIEIVERDTFELQERIIGLRMFPLEMILGTMPKMVEEMAMALGKRIALSVRGGDVILDKVILETIRDPLIHLVRNAADHGLETPEERRAAGKGEEGSLTISCRGEGGSIVIVISDDGRGIDYGAVRERASALYPARKEEIASLPEGELVPLIFLPGFSTSSTVTELSGRGVGLDIVKYNIEKVKGRIVLDSRPGEGTVFTLTLPLTLATIDGYFVRAGGRKFLIPAHFIREVLLAGPEDRVRMQNKEAIRVRDRLVPLFSLSVLLDMEAGPERATSFVLIVESMGNVMGVAIDSVLEYATLIYKSLPANLQGMGCIQGIVFDESYDIVNILHMPALIERSRKITDIDLKTRYSGDRRKNRLVLVVDDSVNSREIQKAIFESAGYGVVAAGDGIEALEKLRVHEIDLIVTDLNMPRMDGFTLIENVKRDESLREIPVIVVSNFDDEESSKRARGLGAAEYIVKTEFDRANLKETADRLMGRRED